MPNTITQRTLHGAADTKKVVRSIHIVSDGDEETDLVIYDNSAFVANTAKGNIKKVWAMGDSCILRLEWDQTTDSAILSLDPANGVYFDFSCFGGIPNPNGTGATGDILLSTVDFDAGDEVTLIIEIDQN